MTQILSPRTSRIKSDCHPLNNSFDTCTVIRTVHFASPFFITHLTEGQDWHEGCFPSGPRS